jgi:hypothetical protein
MDVDEEFWACFVDWQKAFELASWTKLMQISKGTGGELVSTDTKGV